MDTDGSRRLGGRGRGDLVKRLGDFLPADLIFPVVEPAIEIAAEPAPPAARRMPLDAWIKCGKDLSPAAQRRRGLVSGFRRRQANVHRDRVIHRLHMEGKGLRTIAKAVGLRSHNSVKRIIERDATVICAQGRIALLRRTSRRFPITRRRGGAANHLLRREHRSTGTALDVTQTRSASDRAGGPCSRPSTTENGGGGVFLPICRGCSPAGGRK